VPSTDTPVLFDVACETLKPDTLWLCIAVPSGLTICIFATNFRLASSFIAAPGGAFNIHTPETIHATCVPFICRFAMRPFHTCGLSACPDVVETVLLGLTVTFVDMEPVEFVIEFVEFTVVDVLFPPSAAKTLRGTASATKENASAAATIIATIALELLLLLGLNPIGNMVAAWYLGHL
jgi:hypothetical protein